MAKMVRNLALYFMLGICAVYGDIKLEDGNGEATSLKDLHNLLMEFSNTIGSPCSAAIKECSNSELTEIEMTEVTLCQMGKKLAKCVIESCDDAAKYPFAIGMALDHSMRQLGFQCDKPQEEKLFAEVGTLAELVGDNDQEKSPFRKIVQNYAPSPDGLCSAEINSCFKEMMKELKMGKKTVCEVGSDYAGCIIRKCKLVQRYPSAMKVAVKGAVQTDLQNQGFKCDILGENTSDGYLSQLKNLLSDYPAPFQPPPKGPKWVPKEKSHLYNGQMSTKMGGACAALLLVALVTMRNFFFGF